MIFLSTMVAFLPPLPLPTQAAQFAVETPAIDLRTVKPHTLAVEPFEAAVLESK